MKPILVALFSAVGVIGVGVLIPHLIYKDASNISPEEAKELKKEANIFEHPLDFLQITKLVVREKNDNVAFVDAYTFFGVKYAVVELRFNRRLKQVDSVAIQCPSGIRFGINPICR